MKFRVNRGDQNRQWKLDRRQLKFRSGDLERQAHGDLAAHQHHTGGVQGRRGLECDRQYQRRTPGHRLRPPGAVFCDGRGQDLRQLYRAEEAGNGLQMLCPFYSGPSRGNVWDGAHDRPVPCCPGHGLHHHGLVWPGGSKRHHTAGRDGGHH